MATLTKSRRRPDHPSQAVLRPDLAALLEAVSQVRVNAMDQLVDLDVVCDVTAADTLTSLDQGAAALVDQIADI